MSVLAVCRVYSLHSLALASCRYKSVRGLNHVGENHNTRALTLFFLMSMPGTLQPASRVRSLLFSSKHLSDRVLRHMASTSGRMLLRAVMMVSTQALHPESSRAPNVNARCASTKSCTRCCCHVAARGPHTGMRGAGTRKIHRPISTRAVAHAAGAAGKIRHKHACAATYPILAVLSRCSLQLLNHMSVA